MNLSKQLKFSSLGNKQEISTIFEKGKKFKSKNGPIYFYNDDDSIETKFAILVKKNIGKANYRNYIKRIIRFYIRTHPALFENFTRVIFLYNNQNQVNYDSLIHDYDLVLNKE